MIDAQAQTSWRRLTDRLRDFVGRRVPASDTDDVVQEALVRVHRGLQDLREEERFGPWVYRVTRNTIVDYHRARSRDAVDEPLAERDLAAPEEGADDDLGRELVGCVADFVAQLPSPYREAITLTEIEGVSQVDAAGMLGISVSGMKSRVQRGRDRLRAMFEGCCALTLDARGRVIECEPRGRC